MTDPTERIDLSILIRGGSIDQACSWLKSWLTNLRPVEPAMPGDSIYWGGYEGKPVSVTLSTKMDAADASRWLEIYISSDSRLPWPSDVVCARAAFAHFHKEIRCDPGSLRQSSPIDPYEWWAITEKAEGLICWDLKESGEI